MRPRIKTNAVCSVNPDKPQASFFASKIAYRQSVLSATPEVHREAMDLYLKGVIGKPLQYYIKVFGKYMKIKSKTDNHGLPVYIKKGENYELA